MRGIFSRVRCLTKTKIRIKPKNSDCLGFGWAMLVLAFCWVDGYRIMPGVLREGEEFLGGDDGDEEDRKKRRAGDTAPDSGFVVKVNLTAALEGPEENIQDTRAKS